MPTKVGTRRTFLNEPYIVAIQEAGGIPVVLTPAHGGSALRALFDLLDGLVLTGGEDVAPERYREEVLHPNVESVPERDALEFQLLEWALAADLPVLAICRGLQVLNVALGGTLIQDIPSEPAPLLPHDAAGPPTTLAHTVAVAPGSCLAALVGPDDTRAVNSRHHQAVRALGEGLVVTATSPDGVVEAAELPSARFCVGVQWHPENFHATGEFDRLFEGFVAACRKAR